MKQKFSVRVDDIVGPGGYPAGVIAMATNRGGRRAYRVATFNLEFAHEIFAWLYSRGYPIAENASQFNEDGTLRHGRTDRADRLIIT